MLFFIWEHLVPFVWGHFHRVGNVPQSSSKQFVPSTTTSLSMWADISSSQCEPELGFLLVHFSDLSTTEETTVCI